MLWNLSHCAPDWFPNPEQAENSGLLAIGGDLRPSRIIAAYRSGIFPWYNEDTPILWWSPDPRCVIHPSAFTISPRLKRYLRGLDVSITINRCFSNVIRRCASIPRTDHPSGATFCETWIVPDMIQAYERLHSLGFAHSIEIWENEKLVGGLYGVALGRVFFGESMFHERPNASKAALAFFMKHFTACGGMLVDCQMSTPHMMRFGACMMPRKTFLAYLKNLATPAQPTVFPNGNETSGPFPLEY